MRLYILKFCFYYYKRKVSINFAFWTEDEQITCPMVDLESNFGRSLLCFWLHLSKLQVKTFTFISVHKYLSQTTSRASKMMTCF